MTTSKRLRWCRAAVVVLIAAGTVAPAAAQAPGRSGAIRGHVYDGEDGKPIRGAIVSATSEEGHTAMTNEQGAYELRDVLPGAYNVWVNKGSYLRLSYGQRQPFDDSRRLDVRAGEATEDIDFRLPRGGVVTGRIVDEYGEPMAYVSVFVTRCAFDRGRRIFLSPKPPRVTVTTDDLGIYRLSGLMPGPYCVGGSSRPLGQSAQDADVPRYGRTYFPGTLSSGEARPVTIGAGETRPGVDFALARFQPATITGSIDSQGRSFAGAYMSIEKLGAFGGRTQAPIDASGRFVVSNLEPGLYTLVATIGRADTAMQQVTIDGRNIDGLRLVFARRPRVSGTVRIAAAGAAWRPTDMLGVVHTGSALQQLETWVTLNADRSFEARVHPGHCQVRIGRLPAGLVLRTVRLHGVDVTDTGFDVLPDQDVTGIEVELTDRTTAVTGQVTDSRGAPSRSGTVVAFPVDVEKWDMVSRYVRTARPDQEGRFTIAGLPPGDYHLVSIADLDPELANDAALLDRLRRRAVRVSLREGDARVIDLRVIVEP